MRLGSKTRRWAGFGLLALIATVGLSACADNGANFLQPAGPIADTESGLFWWVVLGVSTVVFVLVTTWLLISIVRFRDRPGAPEARQTPGNNKVELAWTIAPAILLFIVLGFTISTMFKLDTPHNRQGQQVPITLHVTAIGHQWWWEFVYPDQKIVTADEMYIPTGQAVEVTLLSDNVIHSFWVPAIAGKVDVIPGHQNQMWMLADKGGTYRGECAEYCGNQHAHMDFSVVAVSSDAFNTWVTGQQAQTTKLVQGDPNYQGQQVFLTSGCVGCHNIDGTTAPGNKIGPNLTHFGSRQWIAGEVLSNTPANLANWILHAQDVKPDVDMPSFDGTMPPNPALSQTQITELVAYLESLK